MSVHPTLTKNMLLNQSKHAFAGAGYTLWDDYLNSASFDFIAKKEDSLSATSQHIVTKIVLDLDLFKKQTSVELQLISRLISGSPLLIGYSADGKHLDEATLYRRHDVSAISLPTLHMLLKREEGEYSTKISKFSHRGGIAVNISKELLKTRRKRLQLNQKILAEKIGVSRHSLYKYEKGESFPNLETYQNLKKILGKDLDVSLNILQTELTGLCEDKLESYKTPNSNLQKEISSYLEEKDFNILWFKSSPFDGLSEPFNENEAEIDKQVDGKPYPIIAGVSESIETKDDARIIRTTSLSQFLQKHAIWFIEDDLDKEDSELESFAITFIKISDLERMPPSEFKKLFSRKSK